MHLVAMQQRGEKERHRPADALSDAAVLSARRNGFF